MPVETNENNLVCSLPISEMNEDWCLSRTCTTISPK